MEKLKKEKTKITLAEVKKNPKLMQASIMLLASCLVLSIAFFALSSLGFFHMLAGLTVPRGLVKPGVISTENQITSIPEGEIRYRLNTDVYFDNLYGRGSIMLENPKVSEFDLEFAFYLPKDQNNPVYQSPRLSPGECLIHDKLTDQMSLKKGKYTCICVVRAYDEEGNFCGENKCTVKLVILDN